MGHSLRRIVLEWDKRKMSYVLFSFPSGDQPPPLHVGAVGDVAQSGLATADEPPPFVWVRMSEGWEACGEGMDHPTLGPRVRLCNTRRYLQKLDWTWRGQKAAAQHRLRERQKDQRGHSPVPCSAGRSSPRADPGLSGDGRDLPQQEAAAIDEPPPSDREWVDWGRGAGALTAARPLPVKRMLSELREQWSALVGRPNRETGLRVFDALLAVPTLSEPAPDRFLPLEQVMDCGGHDPVDWVVADLLSAPDDSFGAVNQSSHGQTDSTAREIVRSFVVTIGARVPPRHAQFFNIVDLPTTADGLGNARFTIPPYLRGALPFTGERPPRHEFQVGTTLSPPGSLSHPHLDYYGAWVIIAHHVGTKLWITWPWTVRNSIRHYYATREATGGILECMSTMEGMEVFVVNEPRAFVLPPFTYHAVLSLETAIHSGGGVYRVEDADESFERIHRLIHMTVDRYGQRTLSIQLQSSLQHWKHCLAGRRGLSTVRDKLRTLSERAQRELA